MYPAFTTTIEYDCNTSRSCWSQYSVDSLQCLIKLKSSLTWALACPLLVVLVYCSALLAISLVLQPWTRNKNRVIIFNIVSRFTTSSITRLLWYKIVKIQFNSNAVHERNLSRLSTQIKTTFMKAWLYNICYKSINKVKLYNVIYSMQLFKFGAQRLSRTLLHQQKVLKVSLRIHTDILH